VRRVTDDRLRRFEERGLTRELGFGERPAVLAVDLVNAFTDPRLPFGSDLDAAVEHARRVLDQARRAGLPVLFTTVAYEDPDLADAGLWAVKVPATATLRAGSPEVEPDGRLGRREDESVLVKKYASAFFGTDLVSRLNALRVDTLVLVGCTTSGCIRATAVDAIQNGFRPMVVREAVGDRDPAAHEQSLLDLQAKYADVVSADSVLAHLASVPGVVPVP
jgi:nicotinamidase-related amidase